VAKAIFDKRKTAIGVQLHAGKILFATKEVIVSAGAIATPYLLLHSGIGPAGELDKHQIPIIHDLPGVGENFIEHPAVATSLYLSPDISHGTSLTSSAHLQEPNPIIFLQSPTLLSSAEFSALPQSTQTLLSHIPSSELVPGVAFSSFIPHTTPAHTSPHRSLHVHDTPIPRSVGNSITAVYFFRNLTGNRTKFWLFTPK
jgi:hypothetical protein